MARKRYSDEDALKILRVIDMHLHDGLEVVSSGQGPGGCRDYQQHCAAQGEFL